MILSVFFYLGLDESSGTDGEGEDGTEGEEEGRGV